MKQIAILALESSVPQAIADPQYLFSAVNQFLISAGHAPQFDVKLVGQSDCIHLSGGRFSVHPDRLLHEITQPDLVIIPALFGDLPRALAANQHTIPWIVARHRQGAEIASLCVGAFLLASTGLLNGKKCSTHWNFHHEFRDLFPDVQLTDGSIITAENRIYSSGGAHSYWNLLLYLVEKYTNREMAILAAKYFAIDIDRHSQGAFAMFKGQKKHGDELVANAQAYIEQHLDDHLTVDGLAEKMCIGRRSLERRFKQATHNSVLEYIQRVRVEAAKRSLENSRKNISEVMLDVGYTDTKAFRLTFKRITGLTPLAYRNKYTRLHTS